MSRLASWQHGTVTRVQLLALGMSERQIDLRIAKRLLFVLYPGVYRVGHCAPSIEADYFGAVLAFGDGSWLSGLAAVHLFGCIRARAVPEVTSLRNRRVRGVISHRVRKLDASESSVFNRIPVTTIPRTLVDVAGRLSLVALGRVCHEAQVKHRVKSESVMDSLARRPRTLGAAKVRRIFEGDFHITLSALERAFLALLTAHSLPLPETNLRIDRRYVDCRWSERALTVELDSYTHHSSRDAWEEDHRRELIARQRGDEYRRYTFGDITKEPNWVIEDLSQLLHRSA